MSLDVLQLVINHQFVDDILNQLDTSDADILNIVLGLIEDGYIAPRFPTPQT